MIAALIAAAASIIVALIANGKLTRRAVKSQTEQNTSDHTLVVEALSGMREDLREVRELMFTHVTDRAAHFYVERSLGSPVSTAPDRTIQPVRKGPISSETSTRAGSRHSDVRR